MRHVLTLLLLQSASVSCAQTLSKECYDAAGNRVVEEKSAYCVVGKRVNRLDTNNGKVDTVLSYIDTVTAYYSGTNNLKFVHLYNQYATRHGSYVEFHENGKTRERGVYHNGNRAGFTQMYYENGKAQSMLENPREGEVISGWKDTDFRIMNYWDSAGAQIVTAGTGFCRCYFFSGRKEVGKVSEGFRDSLWREYNADTLILREAYSKGKLVWGSRYYKTKEYKYKKYLVEPSYSRGSEELTRIVKEHLMSPQNSNITIFLSGTVYVTFNIQENGKATDHKVLHGFHRIADEEALRVAKLIKDWSPGLQRGRPVTTPFHLPIVFKME